MSTTHMGVVIDALVTLLTAALPDVAVIDGAPQHAGTHDSLYIGWDGTDQGDAGQAQQEWRGVGNRARDERMSVSCYAESSKGNGKAKPTRDAALAIVAAVETVLRTDPQLDGALTGSSFAQFGNVERLAQPQLATGTRVGVVFTVTATVRL